MQAIAINEGLKKLWDEQLGAKKIRASLFTLIVYVGQAEKISHFQKLIRSVIAKFPCRVIFILHHQTAGQEELNTQVSAETIGSGATQAFCEIIQIEVSGSYLERVPYLVLPHLLTDLPIYLLWTQDPAQSTSILRLLEPYADRVIFDSESTTDIQNYALAVLGSIKYFHSSIGDLNWSALSGWRAIMAELFNQKEGRLSLSEIEKITLTYAKEVDVKTLLYIEAAFFQSWFASRLNWKFKTIEHHADLIELHYTTQNKEAVVLLSPQENSQEDPGSLISIEIESGYEKGHYMLKKKPHTHQVFVQYSDKNACNLPFSASLGRTQEGQEIVEEIFYPSTGQHYLQTLQLLSTIAWRQM